VRDEGIGPWELSDAKRFVVAEPFGALVRLKRFPNDRDLGLMHLLAAEGPAVGEGACRTGVRDRDEQIFPARLRQGTPGRHAMDEVWNDVPDRVADGQAVGAQFKT